MYLKLPGISSQLKCFGERVNSNGSSITNPFFTANLFCGLTKISANCLQNFRILGDFKND